MDAPICPHCKQPMQINIDTEASKQYICACRGTIYYVNVHKGDKTRKY